jgi:xanthine dehydrogenase YagT iron-sulfur-binding subunit
MTSPKIDAQQSGWSRRNFLTTTVASTMTVALLDRSAGAQAPPAPPASPRDALKLDLRVNGKSHQLALDVRATLLDALPSTSV